MRPAPGESQNQAQIPQVGVIQIEDSQHPGGLIKWHTPLQKQRVFELSTNHDQIKQISWLLFLP